MLGETDGAGDGVTIGVAVGAGVDAGVGAGSSVGSGPGGSGEGVVCGRIWIGAAVARAAAEGRPVGVGLGLGLSLADADGVALGGGEVAFAEGTPASTPSPGDAASAAEPSSVGRSRPEAPIATLVPRSTTATAPTA